jgi:uncharacterized protein YbbK (DUF523 family)
MDQKIRLGISACLVGQNVRYDGGHKLDRFITDTLGKYVEFIPVCPETECGLGAPREAMHLAGKPQAPRLITRATGRDHTELLIAWAEKRVRELERDNLCAFIFKSRSPSCGMAQVQVHDVRDLPQKEGVGLFARVFMAHYPLLPVIDEERFQDPAQRADFTARLFASKT